MPPRTHSFVAVDLVLQSARRLLRMGATDHLLKLLDKQHPVELADVLRRLPTREQRAIFDLLVRHRRQIAAEALVNAGPEVAAPLLQDLPPDEAARLLEGISADDAAAVVERLTEDIQKIGGLEALDEPYTLTPFWTLVKKRGRWLVVLFLGEMLTATAMGYFEEEIARAVVLALFVPLVISSGGNSGSQAASLMIRALAVGEVGLTDWWRVIRREVLAGIALGALLGIVGLVRITVWQQLFGTYGEHWFLVGVTVLLALIGVVLWGTVAGSMLPFLMKRLGADPATSSAPFVATIVDVTGLLIYFSIAAVILRGSLL